MMLSSAEATTMNTEPGVPMAESPELETSWRVVCQLTDILPGTGVAALVDGEQVAILRSRDGASLYALSNFDPFSKAFVIARGIIGDRGGVPKVASPIFKQNFDLRTGRCLDDPNVQLATYPVRERGGVVEIGVVKPRSS
jgi:nitrite reductase (NADH) small subunit